MIGYILLLTGKRAKWGAGGLYAAAYSMTFSSGARMLLLAKALC